MTTPFTGTTGSKSTFTLEPPTVLRLKLILNGEPLKNEACEISFDGAPPVKKSANGEALLEVPIPRGAKVAKVVLPQHKPVEHTLRLGPLPAVDTVAGQKLRLRQLGYYCGTSANRAKADDDLKEALLNFQKRHNLEKSGTCDGPTQDTLKKLYGC
jgi:hypothetical protein